MLRNNLKLWALLYKTCIIHSTTIFKWNIIKTIIQKKTNNIVFNNKRAHKRAKFQISQNEEIYLPTTYINLLRGDITCRTIGTFIPWCIT